ncbi:Ribonuclease H-like domain containing protein [Abeliophyllum distichum]|uniref:Ribonuclease H-like domain containing protein n=1 Tax=Abeliophyllum distichum TaxID=126358 RepID=A0ABD1PS38_9LAMI
MELEMVVEPEAVLGSRPGTGKNLRGTDVLIQWKWLHSLEATWEPFELINQQFPSFHHEDKVSLAERGNDTLPILKTYRRRNQTGGTNKGREGISKHVGSRNTN